MRFSRQQRNVGQGSASHRWIGRTYIAVQCYTWVSEFVGSKTIESKKSIEGTQGDVTPWIIHELSRNIDFCPDTQLQFLCSLIIVDLLNADWLKYNCSDLCSDFNVITAHSRPQRNSLCSCRSRHPQDGGYKRSISGALPLATTFKCKFVAQTLRLFTGIQIPVWIPVCVSQPVYTGIQISYRYWRNHSGIVELYYKSTQITF